MKKLLTITCCLLSFSAAHAQDEVLKNPESSEDIIKQLMPANEGVKFRGVAGGFRGVVVEMPEEQNTQPVTPSAPVSTVTQPAPPVESVVIGTPTPASEPASVPDQSRVEAVTKPTTPSVVEVEKPKEVVKTPSVEQKVPTLNMKVTFEVNSATLTKEAKQTLRLLGEALQNEALKNYRFLIAGHTDASGSASYNQQLSEKRALSVGIELNQVYGVSFDRLSIRGFGEERLLYPHDPRNGDNRRVQVTNMGLIQ